MKTFLRNFFCCFVALFVLAWVMPNVSLGYPVGSAFEWQSFVMALPIVVAAALVLTALMLLAKPILKAVFLPINFLTLGIFNLVLNVFLIWLATYLVPGFVVAELVILGVSLGQMGGMVVFAACFSIMQTILQSLF